MSEHELKYQADRMFQGFTANDLRAQLWESSEAVAYRYSVEGQDQPGHADEALLTVPGQVSCPMPAVLTQSEPFHAQSAMLAEPLDAPPAY